MKIVASRLKYLSMNFLIGGPNFQISAATAKNLADLPTIDANMNAKKSK